MSRRALFVATPIWPGQNRAVISALLVATLLLGACNGSEPPLPLIGQPAIEADRLSWIRRFAIDRVLDYRVWSGARAGFVVLVARNGRLIYGRTTGDADLASGVPMALDTRFHVASLTKPVTAVAAMILVEEGRLSLEDPIANYIPAFGDAKVVASRDDQGGWTTSSLSNPIRVRHLLTFTSGIGGYAESDDPLDRAWRSPDIESAGLGTLEDRVALIPRLPLYEEPGTKWRYGWSLDVLARVIEVAAEEPYGTFLRKRVFDPLGMDSTGFPGAMLTKAPIATMYTHDESESLIHDPQFDDYYGRGWTPGGGGLVSTAPDYMRLALMLEAGGVLDDIRILAPETVEEMTRLQVPSGVLEDMGIEGLGWGLGMSVVADDTQTIMPSTNGDFWWSGRFGTQFWVSPKKHSIVVVMQQTERGPYSDMPVTASIVQVLAMP
jgi:CubicO group peptidase (beta-lactamase class C family)